MAAGFSFVEIRVEYDVRAVSCRAAQRTVSG